MSPHLYPYGHAIGHWSIHFDNFDSIYQDVHNYDEYEFKHGTKVYSGGKLNRGLKFRNLT